MEINCSSCSARLNVPSHLLGKAVRCPKCQQVNKTIAPQPVQAVASTRQKSRSATSAGQHSQSSSKKVTINCPGCGKRLKFAKTASTKSIKCPSCHKVLKLKSAQSVATPVQKNKPVLVQAKPVSAPESKVQEVFVEPIQEPLPGPDVSQPVFSEAVVPQPVISQPVMSEPIVQPLEEPFGDPLGATQPSTGGDVDLFGGLPADMNAAGPAPVFDRFAAPQQFAPTSSSLSAASYGSRAFIPGLLLTIQAAVGILICLAAVALVFSRRLPITGFIGMMTLGPSILGIAYQGAILGGAIQMMRGRAILYGRIVSIMAVVPLTAFSFGFLSALLFYPIALTGGIWGICVLFSKSTASSLCSASPRPSSGNNPYQALGQASVGSRGSDENSGTGMAILYLVGGVGCWILAIGLGIVVLSNLGEARKPAKAIAGVVFLGITGCSLLATGASQMRGEN